MTEFNAILEFVQIFLDEKRELICIAVLKGSSWQGHVSISGSADVGGFLKDLLNILEVENVEDLQNKPCRIKTGGNSIVAISHFLNDNWVSCQNQKVEEEVKEHEVKPT